MGVLRKRGKQSNMYWRMLVFPASMMYLELMFHIAVYGRVDGNILHPIMFGMSVGMVLALATVIFKRVGNAVIAYTILTTLSVYYIVQLIYYRIFDTFLSLVSIGGAENAMNFKVVMFQKIKENIGWIICLLLPVIILILTNIFVVTFERPKLKQNLLGVGLVIASWILSILMLNVNGRDMYSPYNLFHNNYVLELSMNKLGVLVTTVRDGEQLLAGKAEVVKYELQTDSNSSDLVMSSNGNQSLATQTDGVNNTIDDDQTADEYPLQVDANVDFIALHDSTEDETLKNLTAYFSRKAPDLKNEYTGIFDGYNVVYVTAESLSKYGISDTCTPTLNKIMNQGFVFENFYNPRWYHSTIDGEYVNCLGQYPCSSEWSFYKSAETYQPYALGNALNDLDYASYAYHNYTFYYYNRSETHANMGYDFKAIDYGLEIPYNSPYSDLDTMEAVYEEFINEDKFNMYFMSFSGHLPYNYDYNAMSLKNREEAERLTEGMGLYDEEVAYIAAQMELDKALELLIDKLEEAGKLDKTVFIVTPDHYPYGLSGGLYNKMAGKAVEDDSFELHRSCLGIWSSSMKTPVKVDTLCASVDVLPTVLNMLGVEYDSRLLAGHDILSESEEIVIFADHSFITDKVKFNTATGDITYLVDEYKVDGNYIESMIEEVEERLYISNAMIDADYFKFVYGK